MKKSFLVLSALLTLFVCGFCLQSCTSEYDEYTTEEYGSYTEEEVREMKAIAMQYGMSIEFEEDYYGKKSSLQEFERNLISFINLPGDYELVEEGNNNYSLSKKTNDISRSKARSEAVLPQSGQITIGPGDAPCQFNISWTLGTPKHPGSISVTVASPYYLVGGDNVNGNYSLSTFCVAVFQTYVVCREGIAYGRYNISGAYYANGIDTFKITLVEKWEEDGKDGKDAADINN